MFGNGERASYEVDMLAYDACLIVRIMIRSDLKSLRFEEEAGKDVYSMRRAILQ